MTLSNVDELVVAANAFCSAHGIQVEVKPNSVDNNDHSVMYCSAPVSLLPNAFPEPAFEQAIELAKLFNSLVDRVSRNAEFLATSLGGSVAAADPFTAKLLRLYQDIYVNDKDSSANAAALRADRFGVFRSDYMLHKTTEDSSYSIKQVELNTIPASFAGLSSHVARMHQYLTRRFNSPELHNFMTTNQQAVGGKVVDTGRIPTNPSLEQLADSINRVVGPGMVATNQSLERLTYAVYRVCVRYQKRFDVDEGLAILFVVQDGETNTVDQRLLEFRLALPFVLPVIRASLVTIHAHARLDQENGKLVLYGIEIALVYFQAGYVPTDYGSDDAWQARATLERCRAAKCPSLGYHLAGTKKVQQELARPGVLERFVPNDNDAKMMRRAFAGLYSLGDDVTEDDINAIRQVLNGHADRYVLQPQHGCNFYGKQLLAKIQDNVTVHADGSLTLNKSLGGYILMERLFPPQQVAILLRNGKIEGSGYSVSELGIFGTIHTDAKGVVIHEDSNAYTGFLLRTKFSNMDEASGFETLSSPYLC
jgi:glutathione synthase